MKSPKNGYSGVLGLKEWENTPNVFMSGLGDAASHRLSDMDFSCRLLAPSGFSNYMDSNNLVGSFFFDPSFKDLKLKMLGFLLL